MKLTCPLVSIDIESTGTDPQNDAIFQFGAVYYGVDGSRIPWKIECAPWKPIPPEVEKIVGRSNADFQGLPPFAHFAAKIHKAISGKDLLGYNLRGFDLPLLDAELRRCGLKLDLKGVRVIDALGIYRKKEPRRLEDAVRLYCQREPAGSHDALSDATDTLDVLLGQVKSYEDLGAMDADALAKFSNHSEFEMVDLAGKLYRDTKGDVRFGFGKNKDKRVIDEEGYCKWMEDKGDFPESTLDAIDEVFAMEEAHTR